jgi:TolA-binding protein
MSVSKYLQIGLIALASVSAACQKRVQTVSAPIPVKSLPPEESQWQQAEAYYRAAEYSQAKLAYQSVLQAHPNGAHSDTALFRLAMIAAAENSPGEAARLWRRFLSEFPQSPLRTEAELVLALQTRVEELEGELALREEMWSMSRSAPVDRAPPPLLPRSAGAGKSGKTNNHSNNDEELRRLTTERDQLRLQVRRLTEELNALKKIDLERRPSRLPQ